jgi:hypothetical protein
MKKLTRQYIFTARKMGARLPKPTSMQVWRCTPIVDYFKTGMKVSG